MTAERRSVLLLVTVLAVLAIPALVDPGAVARGGALLDLAASAHPWLGTGSAFLRFIWLPIVATSALVLTLAPGLVLVFVSGVVRSAAEWLLLSLAVSVVLLSLVTESTELIAGGPLRGSAFGALALATTVVCGIVAAAFARPDRILRFSRTDAHTLAAAAAGSLITLVAFEPKFLWETFNGDGAHAYESARLLLHQALPFWAPDAGGMSNYPGVTSFLASYPTAWFVRLFGENEASARIPYLLFVSAGLYPGLLALIDAGRGEEPADVRARWLLWPALLVFTAVMGFSATYNPYHADLALPATQDALVIAWFLGFAWAFVTERRVWICAFAALTFATSPAGQVLLGLWLVAAVLFQRPLPVRTLVVAAGSIVLWFVIAKLSPAMLTALGQNVPGSEHSTGSLAKRLLKVQWRQWRRIVYFVVPGGILPALAVPMLWRQDRTTRTIAAVASAQFAFFYFQSRVSLHYFAPAMVLPLAVFWRMAPTQWPGRGKWLPVTVTAAALLAMLVSLPRNPGPQLAARPVGAEIEDRLGGYDESASGTFRRSELLSSILPRDAHSSVPDSSYGGSPLSWFYYAHRTPPPRTTAYLFDSDTAPAPAGARLVEHANGVALYVTDEAALERDRARRPPVSIARIYFIEKQTLFRGN
ncbi:MAG: hypothetical protein ABI742_07440 [Gemmatimonadota bacterium]